MFPCPSQSPLGLAAAAGTPRRNVRPLRRAGARPLAGQPAGRGGRAAALLVRSLHRASARETALCGWSGHARDAARQLRGLDLRYGRRHKRGLTGLASCALASGFARLRTFGCISAGSEVIMNITKKSMQVIWIVARCSKARSKHLFCTPNRPVWSTRLLFQPDWSGRFGRSGRPDWRAANQTRLVWSELSARFRAVGPPSIGRC